MMDATRTTRRKQLPRTVLRFAALGVLTALLLSSVADAQERTFVPPSPAKDSNSKKAATSKPPLPPVTVKALKPQIPENAVSQPREGAKPLSGGDWKIQITPRKKVDLNSYEKIYNAVPYRRSEYLANPSYRHDTTVEILFGEMRHTVVHRQNSPQRVVNPRPSVYEPRLFRDMEYWRDSGRFIQIIPGFGPVSTPRF